jgi:exodeoxyribonuclease VII small subunit
MPKASPTPVAPDLPASYEAALQELEQLLVQMEAGELPLDQLLGSYRRGADLLTFCRDKLEAVKDQIKVLDQGMLKSWTPE